MPEGDGFKATELRRVKIDDLPFVLSLGYERYPPFDPGRMLSWLAATLQNPQALAIRTDHAFLIGSIAIPVGQPKDRGFHVLYVCAAEGHHWETVRLLRDSISWARGSGCMEWWVSSETAVDIEPLAKRVGAKPRVMRYRLDLYDSTSAYSPLAEDIEDSMEHEARTHVSHAAE